MKVSLFLSFLAFACSALPVSVLNYQKISSTQGNLGFTFDNSDLFGRSVSSLGDLKQDSLPDIIVRAIQKGFFFFFFFIFFYQKKYKMLEIAVLDNFIFSF